MKILVVYYSRTGNTKAIAEALVEALNADIDEIIDLKKRMGFLNWLRSGHDALRKKFTQIKTQKNPMDYDFILIGTPIWAGKMTPAVRTYIKENPLEQKKISFFITSGGDKRQKVMDDLREITPNNEHTPNFGILGKEIKKGNYKDRVNSFVQSLSFE